MPVVDYSRTNIYNLICKDSSVKQSFVIATTDLTKTRYRYKMPTNKNPLCKIILENGGWDNWNFNLLEEYVSCISKDSSNARVRYWKNRINPIETISTESPPISTESPPISTDSHNAVLEIKNKLQCHHCSIIFTRIDALKRHVTNRCNGIKSKTKDELEQLIVLQNKKIQQLELEINNNTIRDSIVNYKVEVGNETVAYRVTYLEKQLILSTNHDSLLYYVNKVHFSGKYPECMNIKHTNLKNEFTKTYSEKDETFIVVETNDIFLKLIKIRVTELSKFYNDIRAALLPRRRMKIFELIERLKNDEETIKNAVNAIILMAYNNKQKVNIDDCKNIHEVYDSF